MSTSKTPPPNFGTTDGIVKKIELNPSWMWDCPECGSENFNRSVSGILSDKEIAELFPEEKDDDSHYLYKITTPIYVICKHCKRSFKTSITDLEEDDTEENEKKDTDD